MIKIILFILIFYVIGCVINYFMLKKFLTNPYTPVSNKFLFRKAPSSWVGVLSVMFTNWLFKRSASNERLNELKENFIQEIKNMNK